MRLIVLIILACILAGCATIDFQPYEGKNNLYEGEGGTKVVVDGVDFWANGSPPRKYSIIGMVVSEIGSGFGDEAMIRSSVAGEVKKEIAAAHGLRCSVEDNHRKEDLATVWKRADERMSGWETSSRGPGVCPVRYCAQGGAR